MSLLLLLLVIYYLKQPLSTNKKTKVRRRRRRRKKKFVFEKRIHQVQKNPVHTHTRKRECTPWDARNGKKKASSPTRRHTTLEKSKKDVRTKVILGFEPIILINIHTYIHNSNLIPRWWDIIYQHAYFLCDLAKFQSPLIQIHYYFPKLYWIHTYRYYWIQSQSCFMVLIDVLIT